VGEGELDGWAISSVLLALRVAPVFALAPPFSLTPTPPLFRVLLGLGLAGCMAGFNPNARLAEFSTAAIAGAAASELFLGMIVVMVFHAAFGAVYLAGRLVDIQAGYGLATLIDPSTRSQTPLVGTMLAYVAGVVFFAAGGHLELARILGASLDAIPLGAGYAPGSLSHLTRFMGAAFVTSLGAVGGVVLALFLTDVSIALISRTLPQMNVLVLGFQVKALVLLAVLPLSLGLAAAQLARLMALTLEAVPRLM
jgi:flagellar biosynthetic protein FliR